VLFSNALGAETTVISHSPSKKDDAMKLGAKNFINTTEEVCIPMLQNKERQESV
jgi:alcohol dehydrogenase (NADP+)